MGLYRSEKMKLYQLTLPKDDALAAMHELGDLGSAHFIDLNTEASPYQLPYTSQIKLIEDTERKLNYLLNQSKNYFLELSKPQNIEGFNAQVQGISQNKRKAMNLLLEEIIRDTHTQESFIKQQNEQVKEAEYQLTYLLDTLQVYKVDQEMMPRLESRFKEQAGDIESDSINLLGSASAESNLHKIAGVVDKTHIERLRRLIFRTTKGKSFVFVQDYQQDQQLKQSQPRSIYIIMYWAGAAIREKICRICDSFEGQRFDLPHPEAVDRQIKRLSQSVSDARNVLIQTQNSMEDQLHHFNNNTSNNGGVVGSTNISTIYVYQMFLAREKSLYTSLNMMILQNQTFIGYFWAPVNDQNQLLARLDHLRTVRVASYDNHKIPRPTYVKTNEFTGVFQQIVDTYGIPTYLEANPAVVSIATFPFFFGMMFGDMGHGSVLFFIAAILVLFAKKIRGPKTKGLLSARYLLLMMGLQSSFAGLIYNEFFAIPTNIFGSCYDMNHPIPLGSAAGNATVPATGKHAAAHDTVYWRRANNKCVYPAGQDPVWSAAVNKLTLVNSIKMKMSVIFGVMHMTFGILCKGTNMIYKAKYLEFLTEVLAGIVILWGLFGWMDALILVKFFKTHDIDDCSKIENGRCIGELQNQKTPGIISIMITSVFAFGNYDKKKTFEPIIGSSQDQMYNFALLLLLSVVVCVPIMLLTKPLLFLSGQKQQRLDDQGHIELIELEQSQKQSPKKVSEQYQELDEDNILKAQPMSSQAKVVRQNLEQFQQIQDTLQSMEPDGHDDDFGGIFIHQMIETIEFVLGTVSNTASYLRLWALSLAHTQLADTFLKLPFGPQVFGTENLILVIIKSIIFWPVLWTISFGVLMCMDLLECFLHTLRLHWVEFQNKFYKGEGYAYKPFKYNAVLQETIDQTLK